MRCTRKRFRRAFTLMELLVTLVILSIIASMSIVGLQGYRDRVDMMVCETNMKIDQIAIRLHAIDSGGVAGSLSELRPIDIERAYAQVMEGARPYTMLAYLKDAWKEVWGMQVAEAVTTVLPPTYFQNQLKYLQDPKDPTPPLYIGDTAHRSYQITSGPSGAGGQTLSWFLNPANANVRLIVEVDDSGAIERRHENHRTYVYITVGGKPGRDRQ